MTNGKNRLAVSAVVAVIVMALAAAAAAAQTPRRVEPPPDARSIQVRSDQDLGRAEEAARTIFGVFKPRGGPDQTSQRVDELYLQGMKLERGGNLREAFRLYNEALSINYGDPRLHIAIGRVVEADNPALALYHYQCSFRFAVEEAAQEIPALEVLRRFLVGRYLQYALPIENAAVSAKLLELAQSMAPEDPRLHAHLATTYFFLGMYERSVQESQNALALGMNEGRIYTNIAAAFAQLKRKDVAESYLVEALNLDEMDINEALNSIRRSQGSDTLVTFKQLFGPAKLDELMKNSAKGRLEAALLAWGRGEKDEAVQLAQQAVNDHPRHSYSLIVLGDLKRSLGDTVAALAAYKTALERNAQNQLAYPRLGDLTFSDGDFVSAADYYSKGMDLMSGRVERIDILDRTAVALARQKKHDAALALLDKWLKANPDAPEVFELSVRRAGILADASRTRDAELVLQGLVDRDKTNPAGYIVLYTFYNERNQERKARQIINDGIVRIEALRDQDPLAAEPYRDLARLYRQIGNEAAARKALTDGGLRTREKRFFSNALFAADAETDAFEVLKSWIAAEPRNPEALLSFGWVAAKIGRDLPTALARVDDVLKELPAGADRSPVLRTRAYVYFALKNYEKCIEDIKGFLTRDDLAQAGFFHRLWGLAAQELGRATEAQLHLRKAAELEPEGGADLAARSGR